MSFIQNSLNKTNEQLKRLSPFVQIFAGLAAGTVVGCVLVHLLKSILYAVGLSLFIFELSNESGDTTNPNEWRRNSSMALDTQPYINEMNKLFHTNQSLATSFVSGCLIGVSIGSS